MSSNPATFSDLTNSQRRALNGSSLDFEPEEVSVQNVTPKLVQGDLEFTPLVVTRFGGTLPWNTEVTQAQCGQTIQGANGDMNIRLVFECVATKAQFETLVEMRQPSTGLDSDTSDVNEGSQRIATQSSEGLDNTQPRSTEVRVIADGYSGAATFDQLKFERIPDSNGVVQTGGPNTNTPLYEIQLQTREESS